MTRVVDETLTRYIESIHKTLGGLVSDYDNRIQQGMNRQHEVANKVGVGTSGPSTAGSKIADFDVKFIQTDNTEVAKKRGSIQLGDSGTSQSQISAQASRANAGKLRYSMVDPLFLTELTKVLEFGAQKYERDNWKKGFKYQSVIDSIERHLLAFRQGEDLDPESGLLHLAHVACNVMFLTHYFIKGDESLDDR